MEHDIKKIVLALCQSIHALHDTEQLIARGHGEQLLGMARELKVSIRAQAKVLQGLLEYKEITLEYEDLCEHMREVLRANYGLRVTVVPEPARERYIVFAREWPQVRGWAAEMKLQRLQVYAPTCRDQVMGLRQQGWRAVFLEGWEKNEGVREAAVEWGRRPP